MDSTKPRPLTGRGWAVVPLERREPDWRFVAWWAATGIGGLVWAGVLAMMIPEAWDAHAYFLGEYGLRWGVYDAYVYPPAFSQAIEPLRWLGWEGFRDAWRGAETAVLVLLAGPLAGPLAFYGPLTIEVKAGNIHLLMAAAIVAGFRWPAAWSVMLLTKVTPGVGLLWFAVRREWRSLGIALGVTAAIVVVSFAFDPAAWGQWLGELSNPVTHDPVHLIANVPLWARLPAAAALVVWGARGSRRWVMPIAVVLSLPAMWTTSVAVLVACVPLADLRCRRW